MFIFLVFIISKHCGGVIMKVIVMKLEITQLRCEDILILIARRNVRTLSLKNKVSRKLTRFELPQDYTVHGLLQDYCIFISG